MKLLIYLWKGSCFFISESRIGGWDEGASRKEYFQAWWSFMKDTYQGRFHDPRYIGYDPREPHL